MAAVVVTAAPVVVAAGPAVVDDPDVMKDPDVVVAAAHVVMRRHVAVSVEAVHGRDSRNDRLQLTRVEVDRPVTRTLVDDHAVIGHLLHRLATRLTGAAPRLGATNHLFGHACSSSIVDN